MLEKHCWNKTIHAIVCLCTYMRERELKMSWKARPLYIYNNVYAFQKFSFKCFQLWLPSSLFFYYQACIFANTLHRLIMQCIFVLHDPVCWYYIDGIHIWMTSPKTPFAITIQKYRILGRMKKWVWTLFNLLWLPKENKGFLIYSGSGGILMRGRLFSHVLPENQKLT